MSTSVPSIVLRPTTEPSLAAGAMRLFERVELAFKVARERHDLAALDERMLKDVGLNMADVHLESSRTPWDLPNDRR